jgi:hypothetical protein
MHKTGSMKYLILSLFLLIGNVIRSQNDSPLKKVGDFVLGMNETEFLKLQKANTMFILADKAISLITPIN